ncbi:MAG: hypothetical protein M0R80_25695 [Proteobacteria bacterium]|jgi:hypothetical protein|nr:hypothetical protein [Pseudomonadota bacterium]
MQLFTDFVDYLIDVVDYWTRKPKQLVCVLGVAIILSVTLYQICQAQQPTPKKNIVSVSARNLSQNVRLDGHKYHTVEVKTRFSGGEEQISVQILHDMDCLKKDLQK